MAERQDPVLMPQPLAIQETDGMQAGTEPKGDTQPLVVLDPAVLPGDADRCAVRKDDSRRASLVRRNAAEIDPGSMPDIQIERLWRRHAARHPHEADARTTAVVILSHLRGREATRVVARRLRHRLLLLRQRRLQRHGQLRSLHCDSFLKREVEERPHAPTTLAPSLHS
jgi:hypothetical protein